jgi:hypothetical protein
MLEAKTPTAPLFRLGRKPDPWSLIGPAHNPMGLSVIASTIRRGTIAFSTLPRSESSVSLRRLRDLFHITVNVPWALQFS